MERFILVLVYVNLIWNCDANLNISFDIKLTYIDENRTYNDQNRTFDVRSGIFTPILPAKPPL